MSQQVGGVEPGVRLGLNVEKEKLASSRLRAGMLEKELNLVWLETGRVKKSLLKVIKSFLALCTWLKKKWLTGTLLDYFTLTRRMLRLADVCFYFGINCRLFYS